MTPAEMSLMELLAHALLQNGRPAKAVTLLEALDVIRPEQPQILRALAVALLRAGHPQDALQTLDRLALAGGVDATFHLLRSQALGGLQRAPEAMAAMRTFVELRTAQAQAQPASAPETPKA